MRVLGIIGILLSVWGLIHVFFLLVVIWLLGGHGMDFTEGAAISMFFISIFLLTISIAILSTQKRGKKKISGLEPIKESKVKIGGSVETVAEKEEYVVHLNCPACGYSDLENLGECPDCGLHLK